MSTATLTSKGQITIPRELRLALGLHAGTKLDFLLDKDGFRVVPLRGASTPLKGRFSGRISQAVSIADMDQAIATEAVARHNALAKSR